jgi:hypothetical protein
MVVLAQLKIDIVELVNLIRGEVPTSEVKQNIVNAFVETLNSREFNQVIDERAQATVNRKMEQYMKDVDKKVQGIIESALTVEQAGGWGSPKKKLTGWASEALMQIVRDEFKGQDFRQIIRKETDAAIMEMQGAYSKMLVDAKPFIAKQVGELIPSLVTAEYRERVANHFNDNKMEDMLANMLQKAIGSMIMSGALRFGEGGTTVE